MSNANNIKVGTTFEDAQGHTIEVVTVVESGGFFARTDDGPERFYGSPEPGWHRIGRWHLGKFYRSDDA